MNDSCDYKFFENFTWYWKSNNCKHNLLGSMRKRKLYYNYIQTKLKMLLWIEATQQNTFEIETISVGSTRKIGICLKYEHSRMKDLRQEKKKEKE